MELRQAYPASAKLKSWRRSVRLVRAADRVEIVDNYSLEQPMPVTLNLITTCTITESSPGVLSLSDPVFGTVIEPRSGTRTPPLLIRFDHTKHSVSIETMNLENAELVRNWGSRAFRIRLVSKPAIEGTFNLVVSH
jgi:hypothetical protein